MTKKQFAEIICKKFSLKGITPSSFVYVLNCMLIGIVMVKVPGKNAYKLYFSIYPLWMSNLKECLDMPLFQQPILNNKNMDIYLPENNGIWRRFRSSPVSETGSIHSRKEYSI